ncbi:carboxypeptidase regulatory-like domain-containing protein [Singulisphaera sp. Ch08]|uniref:Carboxypeptidase regulatory-like domain-containing protein n=1 Tax=Singulisphaera sp. Ch08 TaxID=3120278 RepID=A0AAU7CNL1_9BACT
MGWNLRTIALILLVVSTARGDQTEPDLVGTVVDESGKGVAGATLTATTWGKPIEIEADASGAFRLVVPPELKSSGRLWISLLARDAEGRLGLLSVFQEVETKVPVKVVLMPSRELVVVVRDGQGKPVAEADVDVIKDSLPVVAGRTDANGRWVTRVPVGATRWAVLGRKAKVGMDYASADRARGSLEKAIPLPGEVGLKLDGVQPLRVKVVDREGKPIAGVNVGPWLIWKPDHESDINLSGMLTRWPATGQDGLASLDWLPEIPKRGRSILAHSEGYHTADHATSVPPDKSVEEVTITMLPNERLSGRVSDAEGRPAAGVVIKLQGQGGGDNQFFGTARTDAEGRYETKVYSEQAYVLTATRDDLAAPYRSDVVVFAGKPLEGVDLVLGKATRIRGRVTVGKDERPVPKSQVTLLIRKGQVPKELVRPGDRFSREISLRAWAMSDDSGRYEFTVGPGDYQILGPPRVDPAKVSIPPANPPAEIVVDLKMPRPEVGPFAATVVDSEGRPVAGAVVEGMYASYQARRSFSPLKTDDKGSFQVERSLDPLVLYVRTADGKRGGIFRSDAEATEARIAVGPVVPATGRLLDSNLQPVAKRKLSYGIRVYKGPEQTGPWAETYGGTTETDDQGRFTLENLVPGHKYNLTLPLGDDGSSRNVTELTAPGPGPFSLGDVSVDTQPIKPYVPPTPQERTVQAFAARARTSPKERLAAMLPEAKREYTRPLLLFGKKDDPACVDLFRLFNEQVSEPDESKEPAKRRPPTPAELRWEFELTSLDLGQADTLPFGQELGIELGEGQPPILAVLDVDGKVAAQYPLRLDEAKKLDDLALGKFLLEHKLPTRNAEKMLADALARAKAEDKCVWFIASASWCGPCRMLARFLAPRKGDLEPHFVFVKLDISRDLHASSVRDRYKGAAEGGVPWFAILDGDGNPLATSNMPDKKAEAGSSNIGFPRPGRRSTTSRRCSARPRLGSRRKRLRSSVKPC